MRQNQNAIEPQACSHSIGDGSEHRDVPLITPHLHPEQQIQNTRLSAQYGRMQFWILQARRRIIYTLRRTNDALLHIEQ